MAEETKPDGEQAKADAEPGNKTYTEAQMKELIAERDKVKEKLRKIDEERKKSEDAKAIEEGRTKELLEQREAELVEARKEADEAKQFKTTQREALLSKLSDDDKEFAEGMSLDKLSKFVEKQSKQTSQQAPSGKYKPGGTVPKPKFTGPNAAADNAKWLRENGFAD